MIRIASPLLVLALATVACAQPREYDPTPAEVRMMNRVGEDFEMDDSKQRLEHTKIDTPNGPMEAFRGEFEDYDTVIEWLRFASPAEALRSLDMFRAAPNAVKVTAVFGKEVYSMEVLDADIADEYDLSPDYAALAIKVMRNDEKSWLRVKTPEGALGFVPAADVDIDTDSVEVEAPFLVVRSQPAAEGRALSVVSRGEHLQRMPITDERSPDAIVVTAGLKRGTKVWSTAVLTKNTGLDDRVYTRLMKALGPEPKCQKDNGTFLCQRAVPAPGKYNHFQHRFEDGYYLSLADTDAETVQVLLNYLDSFSKEYGPAMKELSAPVKATLAAQAATPSGPGSRAGILSGLRQ